MTTEPVLIKLTVDQALVLFERAHLEVFADSGSAATRSAEWVVFSAILGQLEELLVEPFDPRYQALLAAARARLEAAP